MQNDIFVPVPIQAVELHFTPPFGESCERLLRMRLTDSEGHLLRDSIEAFAIPIAATLYDNLLECGEDVHGIYESLIHLYCNEETTGMYLYLCVLYAQMGEIIPEPVQWLSGHSSALFVFCETLVDQFTDYLKEDGFLCDEEDGEDGNVIHFSAANPDAEPHQQ